jgi:hypothetical protein
MKTVTAILTTSIHPVRLNRDVKLRLYVSIVTFEIVLNSILYRYYILVDIESCSVSEYTEIAFLVDPDVRNVNNIG